MENYIKGSYNHFPPYFGGFFFENLSIQNMHLLLGVAPIPQAVQVRVYCYNQQNKVSIKAENLGHAECFQMFIFQFFKKPPTFSQLEEVIFTPTLSFRFAQFYKSDININSGHSQGRTKDLTSKPSTKYNYSYR